MIINSRSLKLVQECFEESGNRLIMLYGQKHSEKETLMREFLKDKKYFYYRCRPASELEQSRMMGEEISEQFDAKLAQQSYEEYFKRVKSGGPEKLVIWIDEAQYVMKKDPSFWEAVLKLRARRLYPGPVLIILSSSSIVWCEQDVKEESPQIAAKIDRWIKLDDLNFLEVVRAFPDYSVRESIQIYGVLGGVPGYLNLWNVEESYKENICRLVLSPKGALFNEVQDILGLELRELSVYNTILSAIAQGYNKLNDLFLYTGMSRAKISVYMKNLAHFDIVEKVVSFETGGWENAKKGVYQIKNTFVNFWFKFIYSHQSQLYTLSSEDFYDTYIALELENYLNRYFRNVCMEYLSLLNQMGRLPVKVNKMGTWIGKKGHIDIVAQSTARERIVAVCNWENPALTVDMVQEMFLAMKQAKIQAEHYYLFSAKAFAPALVALAKEDRRFELIDMNEL